MKINKYLIQQIKIHYKLSKHTVIFTENFVWKSNYLNFLTLLEGILTRKYTLYSRLR